MGHLLPHADTFDVQSAEATPGPGLVRVTCSFAEGSRALGCHVIVTENTTQIARNASREPPSAPTATVTVGGLLPGIYVVSVFDLEVDGSIDLFTPSLVIREVNITELITSSIAPSSKWTRSVLP